MKMQWKTKQKSPSTVPPVAPDRLGQKAGAEVTVAGVLGNRGKSRAEAPQGPLGAVVEGRRTPLRNWS